MSLLPTSATGRLVAAAAIGATGLALTGAGVYAALTAQATNTTPEAVSSGVLSLTMSPNGAGFTTAISNLAPGDVVNRHISLVNGSLEGKNLTLGVTDATPTPLTTDATNGLQVTVTGCSVAWTPGTGACSGSTTPVLTSTPIASLGTPAALASVVTASSTQHLQVSLALPNSTEVITNGVVPGTSVQGRSAALTWTFTETQRDATTTNS